MSAIGGDNMHRDKAIFAPPLLGRSRRTSATTRSEGSSYIYFFIPFPYSVVNNYIRVASRLPFVAFVVDCPSSDANGFPQTMAIKQRITIYARNIKESTHLKLQSNEERHEHVSSWSNRDLIPLPPSRRTWGFTSYFGFWTLASLNISNWQSPNTFLSKLHAFSQSFDQSTKYSISSHSLSMFT